MGSDAGDEAEVIACEESLIACGESDVRAAAPAPIPESRTITIVDGRLVVCPCANARFNKYLVKSFKQNHMYYSII